MNETKEDRDPITRKPLNPLRGSNAIIAAVLVVFFVVHEILGTVEVSSSWRGVFEWAVWVGVALVVVHIGLCFATTVSMFCDRERPASQKKRRHQYLKWITGGVLALVAAVHMTIAGVDVEGPDVLSVSVVALLVAVLAWHVWVGAKSLTRDLRLPKNARTPFRVLFTLSVALIALFFIVHAGILF